MTRQKRRNKSRGYPRLIGNNGLICWDNRLHPLRMDKKYKKILEDIECDRKSKISEMFQVIEQYRELCDLLLSLEQVNENNSNSALIMELQDRKLTVRKELMHLESTMDLPLPTALNKSMREIFKCNSKPNRRKVKVSSNFVTRHSVRNTNRKHYSNNTVQSHFEKFRRGPVFENVTESTPDVFSRSNLRGSVNSQIFVRINYKQVITISIDLFTSGINLVRVLTEELGEEVIQNKYNFVFGTKELDMNKTLFEQEIYHGKTVDLHVPLRGGKGGKGKGKKLKKKQLPTNQNNLGNIAETNNPISWNKQQVAEWIMKICHQFEINEDQVSLLKNQNGKGLDSLPKEDWIRRSPNHGDTFFIQWQKLKEESLTKIEGGNVDAIPAVKLEDFSTSLTPSTKHNDDYEGKRRNDMEPEECETSSW